MKRRQFITLAGSAAATWPLAARAQQRERMRRIGVLMNLAADDAEGQARLAGFLQGLQEAGWAVGRNAQIDIRWGGGDGGRLPTRLKILAVERDMTLQAQSPWPHDLGRRLS
jgi:DNA-binding LacI/PurR family transcriptional regulator